MVLRNQFLLFPLFDSNEYCIATNLHHNVNKFKYSTSTKEQNTGKNKKKKMGNKNFKERKKVKMIGVLCLIILTAKALQATLNEMVSIQILNKIKKTRLNGRLHQ